MDFPIDLNFSAFSVGSNLSVTDANGRLIYKVARKAFSWKEKITIFADEYQQQPAFTITGKSGINRTGHFECCDMAGRQICALQANAYAFGRAGCNIMDGDTVAASIREANPWVKWLDAALSEVPGVALLTGYFLHPCYDVTDSAGNLLMRLSKRPAFLEGKYQITKTAEVEPDQESTILLALLLFAMKVKWRG